MKKLLKKLLVTTLITNQAFAYDLGQFSHTVKVKPGNEDTQLALIDTSNFSIQWLKINARYLVDKKIPVLVIDAKPDDIKKLREQYPNLLAGQVPEPLSMLDMLTEQIGLERYPAVVENGHIWQIKQREK